MVVVYQCFYDVVVLSGGAYTKWPTSVGKAVFRLPFSDPSCYPWRVSVSATFLQGLRPPEMPKRLLIVRLSAHGDVMQTLPLLGLIRQAYPDTHIGWLVEESAAPLLENHPAIDALHVCRRKAWLSQLKKGQLLPVCHEAREFVTALKSQHYTHSVDVQGLLKSAVWPWLAGIPNRWGYRATREWADRFYTHTLPPHDLTDPNTPTVDWFTRFAEALYGIDRTPYLDGENLCVQRKRQQPWPFLLPTLAPDDCQSAQVWCRSLPNEAAPLLIAAPGTIWPSKTWPADYWYTVLGRLNQWGWRVVLVGSPSERALCEELRSKLLQPALVLNLAGQTTWPQLLALMPHADFMLGLDSAPLHVAQAVAANNQGKPYILGVFGPTGPQRTGPIGHQHKIVAMDLPCQPCFNRTCHLTGEAHHQCMKGLSPEVVLQTLAEMAANQGIGVNGGMV